MIKILNITIETIDGKREFFDENLINFEYIQGGINIEKIVNDIHTVYFFPYYSIKNMCYEKTL